MLLLPCWDAGWGNWWQSCPLWLTVVLKDRSSVWCEARRFAGRCTWGWRSSGVTDSLSSQAFPEWVFFRLNHWTTMIHFPSPSTHYSSPQHLPHHPFTVNSSSLLCILPPKENFHVHLQTNNYQCVWLETETECKLHQGRNFVSVHDFIPGAWQRRGRQDILRGGKRQLRFLLFWRSITTCNATKKPRRI